MKTSRAAGAEASQTDNRAAAARQQDAALPLPRTVSTAPSLKHTALTPAQKEYLNNIAASHSGARVRDLIAQHYLNVLHRCAPSGFSRGSVGTRSDVLEAQPDLGPAEKHKNKKTKSKDTERTPPSLSRRLTSNRRKPKKKSCSSTGRARTEDADDSLSLLSVGEWEDSCLGNLR